MKRLHCRINVIATVLVGAGFSPRVPAQPVKEPLESFITIDGSINAMTETNNVLYLAGSFTSIAPRTGSGVPVSVATGQAAATYPKINGSVIAVVSDTEGGWFVGGTFTIVGGLLRSNLVHIRSDGTVDPGWAPAAVGGAVQALSLAGGRLYLAGSFTNVNGQTRHYLAAADAVSGNLEPWNPDANGVVNALVRYDTDIYIGGGFTSVGGSERDGIAALNSATGQATAWNPGTGGGFGADINVETLLVHDGRLYVGGRFATLEGQTRSRVGSFDLSTGALDDWNPNVGTTTVVLPVVLALAAHENTIFIGGVFTTVGSSDLVNIAALDATTGLATTWDARADLGLSSGIPTTAVSAMSVHDNALFVGGRLDNIGGQPRPFAAALDLVNGDATGWNPQPNVNVLSFCGVGDTIYLGGIFSALAGISRTNLAAFDLVSNQVTSWNPIARGNIWALLAAGNRMYIGGEFTNVNGVVRSNLAALDLTTGALINWVPAPNLRVLALARWNNRMYAGGAFYNISGTARTNLAEFDLDTGLLTSWNPGLNRASVQALAVQSNSLYAGGLISSAMGQARRRIVSFDLTTGLLTTWDPNLPTTGIASIETIVPFSDRVYVGGRFNSVGGSSRTNFVALRASDASVLPLEAHTDLPVLALAATSRQVFLGGSITRVNGQQRSNLAALDVNTGDLSSWNPDPDFYIQRLFITQDTLYAGGVFVRIGDQTSRGIAAFPLSLVGQPRILAPTIQRAPEGIQFQITALGVPQATIQASTNLTTWDGIQTIPLVGGNGRFSDHFTGSSRFYRVHVPY